MENKKIPNTIEKLIDKQKKIRYTSKKTLVKFWIGLILVTAVVVAILIYIFLGGAL